MSKISDTFKVLRSAGKKAFIPYIMAGDPSLDATKRFVAALEEAGADIIELGVPFSDPLADGPTIQRAAERSLAQGVTLRKVLALAGEIRRFSQIPLILMTYYNPVFKYGVKAFTEDASQAGVNGLIIPDLIPDEAEELIGCARDSRVDTIFLLAPTSTDDRIKKVLRVSTGFIYYVSVTGITGSRLHADETTMNTLGRIRSMTRKPVAAGFGVSGPEDAKAMGSAADGVIVGSAIVRRIAEGADIIPFARSLRGVL